MKSFPNGDMFPNLNKYNHILSIFRNAGVPAVLVGGSVRDAILGVESKDIDLATPMPVVTSDEDYEDICKGLKEDYPTVTKLMEEAGYAVYPTGVDHGTVTVMITDEDVSGNVYGVKVEVTTYRIDTCCNGRTAKVVFTEDLAQDLARRDFTINAIAYDGGLIYDYDGGIADLDDGTIRTVGDAFDRFREDYLRPIRAYRFASYLRSTFDDIFMLSNETERCTKCIDLADKIGTHELVSFERVIDEFNKTFKRADQRGCTQFIKDMYKIGVLTKLFPELDLGPKPCHELVQSPEHHPEGDVLTHIALAVGHAEGVEGRWIALLHDIAKPVTAVWDPKGIGNQWYSFYGHDKVGEKLIKTSVKDRLPLSNDLINKAALCTRYHLYIFLGQKDENGNPLPPSDKQVRKVRAAMGEHLPLLRALGYADHMGRPVHPHVKDYWDRKLDIVKERILKAQDLFDKDDGWVQGAELGRALKAAMTAQQEDGITDKAALMEIAYGTRN